MANGYDAYEKARRLGLADYTKREEKGLNPYLPVLDKEIEGFKIRRQTTYKTREIPLKDVAGTKTAGRTEAFAHNFMPLLDSGTEFSSKWINLYLSQLEEGIRDPIKCIEIFGRFFVIEGNKRVSVLKFCGNPSILAEVKEIEVEPDDSPEGALYQAYLNFRHASGLDTLILSSPKSYKKLMSILDIDEEHPLNEGQLQNLKSLYRSFNSALRKHSGLESLKKSGDAFMQYLESFGWDPQAVFSQDELASQLDKLFPGTREVSEKRTVPVMTQSETSEKKANLATRLLRDKLKVAFIESRDPETSEWSAEQEAAIDEVKRNMSDEVDVTVFHHADDDDQVRDCLQKAIDQGNELIFTTNPLMLQISNQFAARYPRVKILNCSLNNETGLLRTYFAREYEVQFLMGLLAGMLSNTGHIGYVASYPIFGTLANINAFAIGVEMANPSAKVYLDWSTTKEGTLKDEPLDIDYLYVDGERFDNDSLNARQYGLFDVSLGKFFPLAKVRHLWYVFYKRIINSVLNNTWKSDQQKAGSESINYWWGISNGLLSLDFSNSLPLQTQRLLNLVRNDMADGRFSPFAGKIESQHGRVHDTPEAMDITELINQNWLNSNIVGTIPKENQFVEDIRPLMSVHGLDSVREDES